VNSVDDRSIPCPGPMTRAIASTYSDAVHGRDDRYRHWCETL
jgi:branched-chain amino acid aminotransferase